MIEQLSSLIQVTQERIAPENTPGSIRRAVTFQKVFIGGTPRLIDASSTLGSICMRKALALAYPMPNAYGNDARVIAACDDIYMDYKKSYGPSERNIVCVVKLYRARMEDDIVKKSTALKTYNFGALPERPDETSM